MRWQPPYGAPMKIKVYLNAGGAKEYDDVSLEYEQGGVLLVHQKEWTTAYAPHVWDRVEHERRPSGVRLLN